MRSLTTVETDELFAPFSTSDGSDDPLRAEAQAAIGRWRDGYGVGIELIGDDAHDAGEGGRRYTIAVDFDGVLHSYATPWIDATTIPDPPVEGAIEWLNGIAEQFDVVILTTRGKTPAARRAVVGWLFDHGYRGPLLKVTDHKVPALVYVDDRGWRFEGSNFPTPDEVHQARPWNKGGRKS